MTREDDIRALRRSVGEPAAFDALFVAHHVAIRRYLHARVGDGAVAEDLAAETFVRAFAARARFRDQGMACGGMDRVSSTGLETGVGGGVVTSPGNPADLAKVTSRRVALVPDGVARVQVRLRGGGSVTVPVTDNVYSYTIHGFPAYLGTTWLDADGRRIDHRKRG